MRHSGDVEEKEKVHRLERAGEKIDKYFVQYFILGFFLCLTLSKKKFSESFSVIPII